MKVKKIIAKNPLPKGILAGDLQYPSYEKREGVVWEEREFELWFTTGFGWCIPTLHIANQSRRSRNAGVPNYGERTYAIVVATKTGARIGMGPHVTERLTVYVTKDRYEALKPYLELRQQGAVMANTTRDHISTRRMATQMRRSGGGGIFGW